MTKPMMDQKGFLDKSGDADLLRETERLMELGVGGHGANPIKRPNGEIEQQTDVVGIFANEHSIRR